MGVVGDGTRRHAHRTLSSPLAPIVFSAPFCTMIPSPRYKRFFEMYPLGLCSTSLHLDLMWFSVMVPVCCKEKFLDER